MTISQSSLSQGSGRAGAGRVVARPDHRPVAGTAQGRAEVVRLARGRRLPAAGYGDRPEGRPDDQKRPSASWCGGSGLSPEERCRAHPGRFRARPGCRWRGRRGEGLADALPVAGPPRCRLAPLRGSGSPTGLAPSWASPAARRLRSPAPAAARRPTRDRPPPRICRRSGEPAMTRLPLRRRDGSDARARRRRSACARPATARRRHQQRHQRLADLQLGDRRGGVDRRDWRGRSRPPP